MKSEAKFALSELKWYKNIFEFENPEEISFLLFLKNARDIFTFLIKTTLQ